MKKSKTKINLIKNKKIAFLGLSVLLLSVFVSFRYTDASDCSILQGDEKDKCKKLEEKAKVYQQIIDIKEKQQDTLENQTALLEAEVKKMENEIDMKKGDIDGLNAKIIDLEKQIKDTEISITLQKKILADLLQAYYENKDQDIVSAILGNSSISSFLSRDDRMVQVENKTNEILKNIKALKDGFDKEKKSVEDKKKEVTDLFYQLQDKSTELNDKKGQKETLIAQTQGEQAKYEKLLARVEEQKQELLDIDQLGADLSADAYDKPPSSAYSSTSWYYSQRDSRWGDQNIGNTKTKMKSYGCAVTAVAMVFTYHDDKITPGSMARKRIFSSDLINWPSSSFGGEVSMSGGYSHGNISWSTVDKELKSKNPVIVYIKKTKGSGGHYVVIHTKMSNGKYVVHDPYWGANLYLDTSRALVGSLSPSSGTKIDQMIIYK